MKKLEKKFDKIVFLEIIYYVIYLIVGLIIFLKSEIANNIVGVLIGTFILIYGLFIIYTFIDKSKIKLFRPNIIFGILNIILGIFIMLNPLTIVNILNIGLGVWILLGGIKKLVLFIELKQVGEECNKLILTSGVLLILMGILIIINPFRSLVITKTIGVFVILDSIVNINDLVLLKRRAHKFLKLFK